MLKKQRTQLSNQLGFHIYAANTGILKYCKNGLPRWVLYLLKRYPTFLKLSKARVSSVSNNQHILWHHVLKISKERFNVYNNLHGENPSNCKRKVKVFPH